MTAQVTCLGPVFQSSEHTLASLQVLTTVDKLHTPSRCLELVSHSVTVEIPYYNLLRPVRATFRVRFFYVCYVFQRFHVCVLDALLTVFFAWNGEPYGRLLIITSSLNLSCPPWGLQLFESILH